MVPHGKAVIIPNSSCARKEKVPVCSEVGKGNLKCVTEPFGQKNNSKGVRMWLNPFFLTLGPAESRSGVLASEHSWVYLFFTIVCCFRKSCRLEALCPLHRLRLVSQSGGQVVRRVFSRRAVSERMDTEEKWQPMS